MSELKKVIISMPSGGAIRTETVSSLVHMLAETPMEYLLHTPMSCYIHINREKSVEYALELGADYLLFIDGDMVFPTDALNKLFALDKDIASVTYNFRSYPQLSIVKLDEQYDAEYQVDESVVERPIPLSAIKNPFRVAGAGTGFMLIKMDVFKKIKRPWFFFKAEGDGVAPVGEDIYFCDKAREHGYEIWVDPSIQMGHLGTVAF